MLYDLIRYAEIVRKVYRLRNLLVHKAHPDLGSRVGYPKYSKQFYRVKKKLIEEGILDKQRRFVESLPNLWLAELPLHARNKEQVHMLGNKVPYFVFLAVIIDAPKKVGKLSEELNFTRMAVYKATRKLKKAGLIMMEDSMISVRKEKPIYSWILRYIDICKIYADITGDISVLFNTIPAYMSGPHAYYMINYEPGRPIGPADMSILTYKPFVKFWKSVINQVRYFKDYPRNIEIKLAKATDEIIRIDRLPYSKKTKLVLKV